MAFKRMLSDNAQAHIGRCWATQVGMPTTLVPFAQNWSLGYESALNQGSLIQWWRLFHSQNNTVSAGPQLGSLGDPRKVTLRRTAQFIWNRQHHWFRLPWFSTLSYPMFFTQHVFKGHRSDRSWIQRHLRNWGAFPKKICKIQPKRLLPASFPGKKVTWVGPEKRLSEGGKWGLVKRA